MVLGKNRVQKKRISVGDFFLKRWKTLGGKTHNKNTKKAKNPQILLNWKKAKKTTSLRHPPGWLHLMCGVWTWLKKIGFTQLHPVVSIIRAWSAHHPTRASRAAASGEGMGKKNGHVFSVKMNAGNRVLCSAHFMLCREHCVLCTCWVDIHTVVEKDCIASHPPPLPPALGIPLAPAKFNTKSGNLQGTLISWIFSLTDLGPMKTSIFRFPKKTKFFP